MGKKLKQLNYNQAYKIIKPYINLDIDMRRKLTKAQKWQISYYFNKLRAFNTIDINGEPQRATFYKPRSEKRLKTLKKKFNVTPKRFKIIPIPEQVTEGGKIRINKNNEIIISSKFLTKKLIPINNKELRKAFNNDDTLNYLKKLVGKNKIPRGRGFYALKIKIWQHGRAKDLGGLKILVENLIDIKKGRSSGEWVKENIDGIYLIRYKKQETPKKKPRKNDKTKKNKNSGLRNRPIRDR